MREWTQAKNKKYVPRVSPLNMRSSSLSCSQEPQFWRELPGMGGQPREVCPVSQLTALAKQGQVHGSWGNLAHPDTYISLT